MNMFDVPYMYPEDAQYTGYLIVLRCPYCGRVSKALIDAHEDFICDCGEFLDLERDRICL